MLVFDLTVRNVQDAFPCCHMPSSSAYSMFDAIDCEAAVHFSLPAKDPATAAECKRIKSVKCFKGLGVQTAWEHANTQKARSYACR